MPQLNIAKATWEKEFLYGKWNYLDTEPAERARSAIIGMYCQLLAHHGKILDVGCGLGTTVDYLSSAQKKKYLGLDLSEEALKRARKKRAHFQNIDFAHFKTKTKFDVVIFNEVLYYLDEAEALCKALTLLSKKGKIIVSLYHIKNKQLDTKLWRVCKKFLKEIEAVEIKGTVNGQSVTWRVAVFEKPFLFSMR